MTTLSRFMQARAAEKAAEFTAKQLERNAKARFAQGTRQAYEEQRQGRLMISNARAAMAGSGTSTTDAGATTQLANIKATADYNALSAVFGAKSEAQGIFEKAQAVRYEGKTKANAQRVKAVSTVLSDAMKIRENWNANNP
ncbi:MAG: hypothetical protein JAY90_20240 [Candidatus Thiodiazotropha lotti]|nr:hypothetical protein [Candidatus Thiodiazotropha lotti]